MKSWTREVWVRGSDKKWYKHVTTSDGYTVKKYIDGKFIERECDVEVTRNNAEDYEEAYDRAMGIL